MSDRFNKFIQGTTESLRHLRQTLHQLREQAKRDKEKLQDHLEEKPKKEKKTGIDYSFFSDQYGQSHLGSDCAHCPQSFLGRNWKSDFGFLYFSAFFDSSQSFGTKLRATENSQTFKCPFYFPYPSPDTRLFYFPTDSSCCDPIV